MAIFTKGTPEMKAEKVTYDNTTSEFVADDVQGAIDEIDTSVDSLNAMKAVTKGYTLSATGWDSNNTYTINDSLITTGTNASTQIIGYPSEQYSDEMYEVLANANIRVISVATGEIRLKAMGGAPNINLPITITYRVGADPITLTLDSIPTSGSNNPITSDGVLAALRDNILVNNTTTPALSYDTTILNSGGLNLNYNPFLKVITVRTSDSVKKALSSGTTYVLARIPSEVIDIIGHHYTTAPFTTSANQTGLLLFNTWENNNSIEITPRGNIASGASIYCCMTFFA